VVELAEEFADGLISFEELQEAREVALQYREEWERIEDQETICPGRVAFSTAQQDAKYAAWKAYYHARRVFGFLPQVHVDRPSADEQRRFVRELFGNPFRPSTVDPACLAHGGGAAAKLARAAYHERILPQGTLDPQRLAVLADALEESGCSDDAILEHLRD